MKHKTTKTTAGKQPKKIPKGRPFPKGTSGNPKGRPPKLPQLDTLLADVLGEEKDGISAAKVILMALRSKAAKGDVRAAEVLLDRAFGKAKQSIEMSGALTTITETTKFSLKSKGK